MVLLAGLYLLIKWHILWKMKIELINKKSKKEVVLNDLQILVEDLERIYEKIVESNLFSITNITTFETIIDETNSIIGDENA